MLRARFDKRLALLALALTLSSRIARAQSQDPAAAELLFSAGRAAFERGDYASACPKFEESQRLDPAVGTLINLAACYEKQNRLATAWETWRSALESLPSTDDRRPTVQARADALERRLPHLEIHLAAGVTPDAKVTRDGIQLAGPALGLAIPVNPGQHTVVVTAAGHEDKKYSVESEEGKSQTLEVEPGPALAAPPAPPSQVAAPPIQKPQREPVRAAPNVEPRHSGRKTLAIAVGAAGAGALVVGGVTGGLALSRKNDIEHGCTAQGSGWVCSDPKLVDAAHSGHTFATVSTIATIVGVVGVGAGVTLYLTSNDSAPGDVRVQASLSGIRFGGVF